MCNFIKEIKCVNLGENVGKLTMALALVLNHWHKCSVDVMFKQGPITTSVRLYMPWTRRWI